MANQINLLDNATVKNLTKPGRHADGGGLFLVVTPAGTKKFAFYYRDPTVKDRLGNGKRTELGLGAYPWTGLQQARTRAAKARALLAERPARSPKSVWAEDKRLANIPTFEEEAEAFLAAQAGKCVPDHLAQVRSALLSHCAPIAGMRVDAITGADVIGVVCLRAKEAASTALRMRGWIEQVLDFAQAHGHIAAGMANPAKLTKVLKRALPEAPPSKHHLSMGYDDAPAFIRQLQAMRSVDGKVNITAFAMELIIRAGCRLSEVRLATWSEFDIAKKEWLIPAERMLKGSAKVKVGHYVPLTESMVALLEAMQAVRCSDYVFPGSLPNKPLDAKNFERLLEDAGLKGKCTTHGFRQTFSNWSNNVNKTRYEIVERALSHKVGTAVGQAYWTQYPRDEHRALTEAWNSHLDAKPANVTRLRA
jgi:integrase